MSVNNNSILGQTDLAVNEGADGGSQSGALESSLPTPETGIDQPLPRPARRPRRAKADRGLPPDGDLILLARAYLERQRKLWPEIAKAGFLSEPTDHLLREMVEDFKNRHRTGRVNAQSIRTLARLCEKFAGSYNRFSCDNSSPLSIIDQMVNSLEKAKAENRFIPWSYLFADYSITGLNPARQGYSVYKAVLRDNDQPIETTYIDDFTRASRDELEWWKLASLSKRLNKRMIGASDGFDINSPDWDVKITIYGLVSRLFIKGLREKVRRGMKGAAGRGTCLGKLPLGFTRQVCRDANGEIVRRPDGRPRHKPCIDPVTKPFRVEMFELFVHKGWSPYKIARRFNQLKVDGSSGWTSSSITSLLEGADALGTFTWNRYRNEFNYEEEKYEKVENPKSEWVIYSDPNLALVTEELWQAAQRKLLQTREAHPLTGKKWSRNQKSASTLFSGTLYCGYCGAELRLNRSAGKYKVMSCLSGSTGVHDCPLTTSKSTQIIEDCLLGYLNSFIFTEERISELVEKANVYLEQEACKPRVDTGPLYAKVAERKARIKKLVTKVEQEPDEELCEGYHARIKEIQKEVNAFKAMISEAEAHNESPPAPLDAKRATVYLTDLRGVLNEEVPLAAEAIRTLSGPIKIHQEKVSGTPGARWIATFTPDLISLLRKLASKNAYPDGPTLAAVPSNARSVSIAIEKVPKYARLAPLFKQLSDNGASVQSIANLHGMSWEYADQIIKFAETGERPKWGSGKGGGKGKANRLIYKDIAPEVVRMRNVEEKPFEEIADILNVGIATVFRAYDFGCPDAVREAVEAGKMPRRGKSTRLGKQKHDQIRALLQDGKKDAEIATTVGCGKSTVGRVRRAMEAEAEGEQAA